MSRASLLKPESVSPTADIHQIAGILAEREVTYVVSSDNMLLGAIYRDSLNLTPNFIAEASERSIEAICVVALFSGMAAPESGKKHLPHGGKVAPPS